MCTKLLLVGLCTSVAVAISFLAFQTKAQNRDTIDQIVAVQVRKQGHQCSEPLSAQKQKDGSSRFRNVWRLTCKEAKYRVTIRRNRAAVVEIIE